MHWAATGARAGMLADLTPPVADAFLKDTITIGHALLIAKLPDSQQQEAFNAAFRVMWTSEGNQQVLIPVRGLAAWIESNILPQLASAPSNKQDEALVPAAGSCANCPSGRDSTNCSLRTCARILVPTRNASGQRSTRTWRRRSKPTSTGADFFRLEYSRGRSLGEEPLHGACSQESQSQRHRLQGRCLPEALRKDDRSLASVVGTISNSAITLDLVT
jgi:hypothetical protein